MTMIAATMMMSSMSAQNNKPVAQPQQYATYQQPGQYGQGQPQNKDNKAKCPCCNKKNCKKNANGMCKKHKDNGKCKCQKNRQQNMQQNRGFQNGQSAGQGQPQSFGNAQREFSNNSAEAIKMRQEMRRGTMNGAR